MVKLYVKNILKLPSPVVLAVCCSLWACSQSKNKVSTIDKSASKEARVDAINVLRSLDLEENKETLAIRFEADKAVSPNIFRLSDPQRIVVDLVNTKSSTLKNSVDESKNPLIKEVTVNEFNDNDSVLSRVVIVLSKEAEYEAHALEKGLALKILGTKDSNDPATDVQSNGGFSIAEFSLMESGVQNQVGQTIEQASLASPQPSLQLNKNQLIKVLSRPNIDGTEIEMIFADAIKDYRDFSLKGPNRIVFDLTQVENVLTQGKKIDVMSDEVAQIRLGETSTKTRAVIDLSGNNMPQYKVSKDNNRLKIYIPSIRALDRVPVNNPKIELASRDTSSQKQEKRENESEAVSMVPVEIPTASGQSTGSISQSFNANKTMSENAATGVSNIKPGDASNNNDRVKNELIKLSSIDFEKDKQQALINVFTDKDNISYRVLDSQPGLLKIEIDNISYKKSKIKKALKSYDFTDTAIKAVAFKKKEKNSILIEVSMKEKAIFEVGEQEKGLIVRVSPNNTSTPVDSSSMLAKEKSATQPIFTKSNTLPSTASPVLDDIANNNVKLEQSEKTIAPQASVAESPRQIETLANDLVEVEGLDDELNSTFPQERVIENPLGLKVQDSQVKNYAYVKEEFMSDTIADGEPLSQMGSILSGAVQGKQFTGRRISLDFKDAEVKSIFKLIAEISQFNIIISDDVTGRITIRLDEVPWDQAFAIILQTRGLWFEKYGNIIRVAPAANLQREKEAAANAEAAAKAVKPLDILFKPVSFAQAGTLEQQVQSVLSERGTVDIDSRTNTLIIKDIREHLDKAKRMIDILDTQTPQVTIEARIVEATTTFTRSFGINWSGSASFSSATGNPTGLFFPNSIGIPNFALNFPIEAGAINTQANLRLGSINNILDLDLAIALGEQEGNFKLISSPKVTVLDNSSATISAGTQIPYQTQSDNLGTQVNFQTANTSLTVTPHITNDGSILMNISATRDEPNFSASVDGNPTIDQRTASTEVLVKSGNTTVIGGIYSTSAGGSQSRLPFFHKIPIIGSLFKNYNKTVRRSELLIFVTPRIVGDERKAIRNVRE